jgi:hypothetical protein
MGIAESLTGIGRVGFPTKGAVLGNRQNIKIGVKKFFVEITGHAHAANEAGI